MACLQICRSRTIGLSLVAQFVLVWPAFAAESAEQVLRREFQDALERAVASGALGGREAQDVNFSLMLPAQRRVDLGLVLDSRHPARAGIIVLGTTPGGVAQTMGLRAGDTVTAIGKTSLVDLGLDETGSAHAIVALRSSIASIPDDSPLSLSLVRDGRALTMDGKLVPRYLPALRLELGEGNQSGISTTDAEGSLSGGQAAADTCGRVSTFHNASRSGNFFSAKVLLIDGRTPGAAEQNTFRLAPGRHTLLLSENIDAAEVPTTLLRRRHVLGRKNFEVLVQAGQTALLAVRATGERSGADYWEPVVWRVVAEPCR